MEIYLIQIRLVSQESIKELNSHVKAKNIHCMVLIMMNV